MSQGSYWMGLSEAFSRIAAGVARFVRYELDLAAIEAREDLSRLLKSARLLAAGIAVAIAALAALLATVIAVLTALLVAAGLAETIASSLACFITALSFGIAAWVLFASARTGMRDLAARLERIVTVFAGAAAPPPAEPTADGGPRSIT
jgi:uncharacterized membrane protein YqjE